MRIKRGVNADKKRSQVLMQARGYRDAKSKLFRIARQEDRRSGK